MRGIIGCYFGAGWGWALYIFVREGTIFAGSKKGLCFGWLSTTLRLLFFLSTALVFYKGVSIDAWVSYCTFPSVSLTFPSKALVLTFPRVLSSSLYLFWRMAWLILDCLIYMVRVGDMHTLLPSLLFVLVLTALLESWDSFLLLSDFCNDDDCDYCWIIRIYWLVVVVYGVPCAL